MSAGVYTPGVAELYLTFRNESPQYFGTCITAPEIEKRKFFHDVNNDLGGRLAPFQKVPDGQQDIVTIVVNRFDMSMYNRAVTNSKILANLGTETRYDRGSLAIGVYDVELTWVNTFFGSNGPLIPTDLPAGRRYYSALLVGGKESAIANRVEEIAMVWECNSVFIPGTRGFQMYSETNFGSLPNPN